LKTRNVILDLEADGLLDTVTTVWCIVCKDIDTGEIFTFHGDELHGKFKAFAETINICIGHNHIEFDLVVLDSLLGIQFDRAYVIDTLVLSKLYWQARPEGHSLAAWGIRLKSPKIEYNDWSRYSDEMLKYCIQDVELNHLVYLYLKQEMPEEIWAQSIRLEHDMAWVCRDMHDSGFSFDYERARVLERSLLQDLAELDSGIATAFPARLRAIREVLPRLTQHGTISRANIPRDFGGDFTALSEGSPFTWCEVVEFNAGSPKQVIERLNEFGWKPVDKTKGHLQAEKRGGNKDRLGHFREYGWQLNERNLATLPESAPDAARLLVKRGLIAARLRTLTEWFSSYNPHTGRVHGTFDTLGTWTHRLSHRKPNLGNIAAKKSIKYNTPELKELATNLGGTMRDFWRCEEDEYLVGTDMDSAHLRIFAHLINDPILAASIDSGDKAKGTDPHTINMHKLGRICPDRDRSKTFIYTFLNGGGVGKVASIFGCSFDDAKEGLDGFIESYPLLKHLKENVFPKWAERGYFLGLDGRKVACNSAHAMMAGILQNYEAILMKQANILWREIVSGKAIPYRQVNLVHDEFVTAVRSDYGIATEVGEIQAQCIAEVGVRNKLMCPLRGDSKVGKTWLEIH
jgi:DNA polymerase-1